MITPTTPTIAVEIEVVPALDKLRIVVLVFRQLAVLIFVDLVEQLAALVIVARHLARVMWRMLTDGRNFIGQKVKVNVISVLQTQAGRMIFAKMVPNGGEKQAG